MEDGVTTSEGLPPTTWRKAANGSLGDMTDGGVVKWASLVWAPIGGTPPFGGVENLVEARPNSWGFSLR